MRSAVLLLALAATARAADLPPGAVRRIGDGRFLHADAVRVVAPSPDGRVVASTDGRAVYGWDPTTGRLLFRTPADPAHERGWSRVGWAGGRLRAVARVGGPANGLRAADLDPVSGRVLRRGPVVAWERIRWWVADPRGERVVLAARRTPGPAVELALHDLTGDRPPVPLTATPVLDATAEFAPDGKTLAVAAGGPVVRLFDAAGKPARELRVEADAVRVGPFTPDGTGLAVLAERAGKWSVEVRDVATGAVRAALPTDADGRFVRVRFAPDGKRAAVQEHRAVWEVIDLATRAVVCRAPDDAEAVEFAPDGRTFYAVPGDGSVIVPCDAATGKPTLAPAGPVYRVRFRADGKLLGLAGGRVVTWDAATGAELARSTPLPDLSENYPAFGAFSPDGTRYAYLAGTNDGRVHLYDLTDGLIRASYDTGVRQPAPGFTRAGALVLPHPDRVGVYDPAAGAEAASVRVGLSGFRGMEASADGRRLALGAPGGVVVVGLPAGGVVAAFPWPGGGGGAATLSPDGRTVVAGGDGVLAAWDVGTGRRRWERQLPDREVRWANVLPDGRSVTVAARDHAILLVELATGGVRDTFPGTGPLLSYTVAPDGRWVATASPDAPVTLWDVRGTAGPPPGPADPEALWADLASADAAVGFRAVRALARHPDRAVPFLAGRVKPVAAADPATVAKLIADLDSPVYAVREAAARELKRVGEPAGPALEAALAGTSSSEVRERAKAVLAAIPKPTAEDVRRLRAAEALEWIGTPAAAGVLRALAGGADGAALTRDARAAVGRLAAADRR